MPPTASADPKPEVNPSVYYAGMHLNPGGWGEEVVLKDILKVLLSTKDAVVGKFKLTLPPLYAYYRGPVPLAHAELCNGMAWIRLTAKSRQWSQYTYQFAHELCHVIAHHTVGLKHIPWQEKRDNSWLEESFCEAFSWLALKRMAKTWLFHPPYPNWRDYASNLQNYYETTRAAFSAQHAPKNFLEWFQSEEASLRSDAIQRSKNAVVADKLLPLLERHCCGIGAISRLSTISQPPGQSLDEFLSNWVAQCLKQQQVFVNDVALTLGRPSKLG